MASTSEERPSQEDAWNGTDLDELIGQAIVVDTDTRMVYLGILTAVGSRYLRLAEVDVHEVWDVGASKERYIHETRKIGLRPTRKRAWVNATRVVSISRLEDVLIF